MYAPSHHAATRHAIGPRRELGVRTMFNVLGPLTNPAGAKRQVIGLFSVHWLEPLAQVLRQLGSEQVLLVHAQDGLDEISIAAPTEVAELRDGEVSRYRLTPEQIGVHRSSLEGIAVRDPQQSLAITRAVFANTPGPALEIVCANAGAAIYACGLSRDIVAGVKKARHVIADGAAGRLFATFIEFTTRI
jgi:anthranilate phosphoribosyltransferase